MIESTLEEIWKDVVGYEGLYQVSNLGNVKSLVRNKILKPDISNSGYLRLALFKNKVCMKKNIHRLVAEAFIPNPENKPQVNHINGVKTDNKVDNLEWCTRSENQIHAYKTGLQKPSDYQKNIVSKIAKDRCSKKVNQYDLQGQFIKQWFCMMDAERDCGINNAGISSCCKGKRKQAGGFIWRYAD